MTEEAVVPPIDWPVGLLAPAVVFALRACPPRRIDARNAE